MRYLLILIVLLLAIPTTAISGEPEQAELPQTSPEDKREWTRQILLGCHLLDQPRYRDRFRGVEILTNLPAEAEPLIIERLGRVSFRAKLHIFEALVNRKSEAVAALIIATVRTASSETSFYYLVNLLRHAPHAWESLAAAYSKPLEKDERRPALERLYTEFIEIECRSWFVFCLEEYNSGYFRYMFDRLWKYGQPGIKIFISICKGEVRPTPFYNLNYGRPLAAEGLIDWPHPKEEKIQLLQELAADLEEQANTRWLNGTGRDETLDKVRLALHQLGVTQSEVESSINRNLQSIEQYKANGAWSSAITVLHTLAQQYLSIRDNQNAAKTWNECIAIYLDNEETCKHREDTICYAWYNLACIRSLDNDPDKAISALRQAVAHGYVDFNWMWTDRDLQNTWNTEPWKKWISELKEHELYKFQIPEREPGSQKD